MNHIKRQENTIKTQAAEIVGLRASITDLLIYLSSPKFHQDPTVQVADVFLRIRECEQRTQDLIADQIRINQENTK